MENFRISIVIHTDQYSNSYGSATLQQIMIRTHLGLVCEYGRAPQDGVPVRHPRARAALRCKIRLRCFSCLQGMGLLLKISHLIIQYKDVKNISIFTPPHLWIPCGCSFSHWAGGPCSHLWIPCGCSFSHWAWGPCSHLWIPSSCSCSHWAWCPCSHLWIPGGHSCSHWAWAAAWGPCSLSRWGGSGAAAEPADCPAQQTRVTMAGSTKRPELKNHAAVSH